MRPHCHTLGQLLCEVGVLVASFVLFKNCDVQTITSHMRKMWDKRFADI